MLAHDVIQDPVDSLAVMQFLGDFSLVSSATGANQGGKDGPAKGVFDLGEHMWHGPST